MGTDAVAPQLRLVQDVLDGKMNWNELQMPWSWRDTRVIPLYAVLLSVVFLFGYLVICRRDSKAGNSPQNAGKRFESARILSCILLSGLSVVRVWNTTSDEWGVCAMVVIYLYTTLLALLSVLHTCSRVILTRHVTLLMLATLTVYTYRDIWQLATYDQKPLDAAEGWFVWAEIGLVAFIAVLLPLFTPRQYVPIDPTDPGNTPSPEQTASLASLLLYTYLDPIIVKANTLSHLPYTELPTLADYDHAKNIAKYVDPIINGKRHIFFGLLRIFRYDFSVVAVVLIIQVCASFAAPIGINRVLAYLETGRSHSTTGIRPWFWVLWLFLGPTISFLTFQLEVYLTSWMLVRMESLITQLLFEHSLRMRVKAEVDDDGKAKGNLTGRLNNLVTSDLSNIGRGRNILDLALAIPLKLILCLVFLNRVLGWSAFAGLASIIVLFPVPGLIAARIEGVQVKGMKMTDERVQTVTESINVLRMIKLFGWESMTNKKIDEKRIEELQWIRTRKVLEMGSSVSNFVMLSITTLVTYGTFTVIMKQELSASIVFSSASVFNMLRLHLDYLFQNVSMVIQAKVSLDRLNDFLHTTELLDSYSEKDQGDDTAAPTNHDVQDVIGFKDAAFAWATEGEGSQMPSNRLFKLRIDGEVIFKRNCINLIVGPTGSGKTAILMALLGEMHFVPSNPSAWYNLPRKGGIAYAAQESWVQNDTIRENILFGSPFDESRYRKVLHHCALERDLELFEAGDQTEVGERGLTLSGGQKARVTLARAVYSTAEIILLDDVLAALDAHTSKWIIENCFLGDLIKGRTVLLVTHNLMLATPLADFVVDVDMDGNVTPQGSGIAAVLSHDQVLASEVQEEDKLVKQKEDIDSTAQEPNSGKLVIAEEIKQGRVDQSAYNLFLFALGGKHPVVFLVLWIAGIILTEGITNFQIWYLGYWGSKYETRPSSEISATYYMTVYSLLLIIMSIIFSIKTVYYMLATMRASRNIHERLVRSVLGSTFRWLDETPTSRVIARCTQDIQAVDGSIPDTFSNVVEGAIMVMYQLGGSVIFAPIFIFPGIGVAALGLYIASVFLKAQLSVKREMSNAKSPVLSHFSAAITGLVSIRAFGAQGSFRDESHKRIDHYARISRTSYNMNRWISIRMEVFGVLLTGGLAAYLVYGRSTNPANAGFSLTMAADLCPMLLWWVQVLNIFEVQSNSLERIKGYIGIDQEQRPQQQKMPPAAWPSSGKLIVDGLYARYSPTGPLVLHDISFQVRPGERIGVVGRTGSGKSSLTLSLLRCIPTEGHVYYDDHPTMDMGLDTLRSNITIIPQMPELLSGTIRRNLDPFEQYDDLTLANALRSAGLMNLQDEAGEGRITLDSNISAAGSNLSVGQRQIIALARAIVRGSKLLILDEATSAIDQKTDAVIQKTLRNELSSDVTVIIVAHRLQTIMDADKIMVLDNGRIVEFDSPKILLSQGGGMLKLLVDSSVDKDALYAMAMGRGS